MPLQRCGNGEGWKYGDKGTCYFGKNGKKKAIKQGIAIDGEDGFKDEMSKGSVSREELEQAIAEVIQFGPEIEPDTGNKFLDAAQAYVSQKERDKMSSDDFGDPAEKKYPVKDQKHLDAAVKLLGRAPKEKQAAIKKRLKEIAHRKGLSLPASWDK